MSLAISYFVEPYFLVSRVCICSFLNIYWSFERLILWMIYCLKTSFKRSPSQNVMNWHHIFWYSALVSEVFSIIIDHLSGWSFEWSFIWKRHSTYFVEPYFLVSRVCIWVDPRNREVKTYQKRQLFFPNLYVLRALFETLVLSAQKELGAVLWICFRASRGKGVLG